MDDSIIARVQSFKEWFRGFEDSFIVIGGTACSLIMNERGAEFRATKDVDLVLLLEVLSEDFGRRFWDYILAAGYQNRQKSTGKTRFYRFYKPALAGFPEMIELFSRRADGIALPDGANITPIPISEDISSLSAILLNDHYYHFLREGVRKIDGFPVLDELYMIPFKAKAWLDMTERRGRGESIDRNDINKHRRDIYRLSGLISGGYKFSLPASIEKDMNAYIAAVKELMDNSPPKARKEEKERIEKIAVLFGLRISL